MTQRRHDRLCGRAGDHVRIRGERADSIGCTENIVRALSSPAAPVAAHDALRALAPPSAVKRNTLLLAASQAFVGVGNQMVPTLGAIIVARLLGSVYLAGLDARPPSSAAARSASMTR